MFFELTALARYSASTTWLLPVVRALIVTLALLPPVASDCQGADEAAVQPTEADFIQDSRSLNLGLSESAELDALILKYEDIVSKWQGTPGVEWAMWDLGRLYSLNNTKQAEPVGDSLKKSIASLRRAADLTKVDSGLGREVQLDLAVQLRRSPDQVSALPESRRIIEDVAARFPDDEIIQLRCREQMVHQFIAEKRIDDAEEVCRAILSIQEFKQQGWLDGCKVSVINALLQGKLKHGGQGAVSDTWLDGLVASFPNDLNVASAVNHAKKIRVYADPSKSAATPLNANKSRFSRWLLIAMNVLLGIAALILFRRSFARSGDATTRENSSGGHT